jgi:hypothetical protein
MLAIWDLWCTVLWFMARLWSLRPRVLSNRLKADVRQPMDATWCDLIRMRSGHGSKAGKQLEAFKSNYEDEKRQSLIRSRTIGLRREPKKRTKDGLTVCDVCACLIFRRCCELETSRNKETHWHQHPPPPRSSSVLGHSDDQIYFRLLY